MKGFLKRNWLGCLLLLGLLLLSFWPRLLSDGISIDTELLINDAKDQLKIWMSSGRYGLVATKLLLGLLPFNAAATTLLTFAALYAFGLLLAFLTANLLGLTGERATGVFVLPAVFLTAPILAEQFNFLLQSVEMAFALCLCALSALWGSKWVLSPSRRGYLALSVLCALWAMASYQALVVLVAALLLYCYLLLCLHPQRPSLRGAPWRYAGIFAGAGFLLFGANKLYPAIFGSGLYLDNPFVYEQVGYLSYLDGMVRWGSKEASTCLANVLKAVQTGFLGDGLYHTPLYAAASVLVLGYAAVRCFLRGEAHKTLFVLCSLGLVASPFLLSLALGGGVAPRTELCYPLPIAFALLLLWRLCSGNRQRAVCVTLAMALCFSQGLGVSGLYQLEGRKSKAETALAQAVAQSALAAGGGEMPVVFIGKAHPGPEAPVGTDLLVHSFFEWDAGVVYGSNYRIHGLIKTLGYSLTWPTQRQITAARALQTNMPVWPALGSVAQADGLVIVKLSQEPWQKTE